MKPRVNSHYHQGYYKPVNEKKYIGQDFRIIYRSGLELKMCNYLDYNKEVVEWSSESIKIPYLNSVDQNWHNYYPDFYVMMIKDGVRKVKIIEVKPSSQIVKPKPPKRKSRKAINRYNREARTYVQNMSKFKYAKKYCADRGWEFVILTEKSIKKLYS